MLFKNTKQNTEHQLYSFFYIKLGSLMFLASWFGIACLTNLFDFINALYRLPDWHFRSGNYELLAKALQIYNSPQWFLNTLFTLDILALGTASILFAVSGIAFFRFKKITPTINLAFATSMAFWAVFIVMDEIFIAYSFEGTHIRLLILEFFMLLFFIATY